MQIIDPCSGKPLTADAINADAPTPDDNQAAVRSEDIIIELNAGNIQQVLEAFMKVPVLLGCYSPSHSGSNTRFQYWKSW